MGAIVLLVPTCAGFVPFWSVRNPIDSSSSCFVDQVPTRASTGWTGAARKPRRAAASRIRMGVMEDFLTGQDDAARKRENEQYLAQLSERVDRINELEAGIEELADDELVAKTDDFRERLRSGEDINGRMLEEAFAVVREAAW